MPRYVTETLFLSSQDHKRVSPSPQRTAVMVKLWSFLKKWTLFDVNNCKQPDGHTDSASSYSCQSLPYKTGNFKGHQDVFKKKDIERCFMAGQKTFFKAEWVEHWAPMQEMTV